LKTEAARVAGALLEFNGAFRDATGQTKPLSPGNFCCKKSSPVDSEKCRNCCDMSANDSIARTAAEKVMAAKKHASGWQIRCLKCGYAEPCGKHGTRPKAAERSYIFGRCPKCKRIRFRVIEKVPTGPF
jgi:predicted nucleic-acid-binding Zn-ribbon protein